LDTHNCILETVTNYSYVVVCLVNQAIKKSKFNKLIMNLILKISAIILIISGFILTCKPDLISSASAPLNGYEMIEKRVKWGFLIGLGIFLIFPQQWADWGLTLWALLSALALGIIIARLVGFVLDGLFAKQIQWLLIEMAVLCIFSFLYWRQKTAI